MEEILVILCHSDFHQYLLAHMFWHWKIKEGVMAENPKGVIFKKKTLANWKVSLSLSTISKSLGVQEFRGGPKT